MTPRTLDATAADATGGGASWLPRQVWLVVDGTVPLERGLAQTAIRLVLTGHCVTIVLTVPRPGWTLNARLAERLHYEQATRLWQRRDELRAGLRAGLGDGPCPTFDGGGRIQVRWTTEPRRGPIHWLRGLLRWREPAADNPLQHYTGLSLAGIPPRTPHPGPRRATASPACHQYRTTTSRRRP